MIKYSPKKHSNSKFLKRQKTTKTFWICDLSDNQASFVDSILTVHNMKYFEQLKNHKYHVVEEADSTISKPKFAFICDFQGKCGKSNPKPWNLIDHIRTHTREKPFTCEEWGKRFSHVGNLNKHRYVHLSKS